MTPAEVEKAARMYRRAVVCWAASYVGEQAAEDVAQAAFAALVRHAEQVEPRAVASWLRAATWKLARDHRPRPAEVLTAAVPEGVAHDTPEDTVRSAQLGAAVRRALATMPASRRGVVVEVLAEGRSIAEVAREDGIPESTVRAQVQAGAAELRGVLVRERASERRRSGGFSSWAVFWAIADFASRARRIVRGGVPVALGASIVGGALLALPAPVTLGETEDEMPARAVVAEPVPWPVSEARAAAGVERVAPVMVAPRTRHDAGARFRAERFGR